MKLENDVKMEDFVEFFGKTREELLKPREQISDDEWKRKVFRNADSLSREALHSLYKDTDYYLMDSREVGGSYFSHIFSEPLVHLVFQFPLKMYPQKNCKILEWGCGTGRIGLKLALLGYDVTLADIPHPHFHFIKLLCEKYLIPQGFKINFIPITVNELVLTDMYDYIICREVLEHVADVEPVLDHLVSHLRYKNWMFLSYFFDDMQGHDPSHLHRNTLKYNNPEKFLGILVRRKLIPMVRNEAGTEKVFQKLSGSLDEILLLEEERKEREAKKC